MLVKPSHARLTGMGNQIGSREDELQALRRIDIAALAAAYGFTVDPKESRGRTTMMRSSSDKIGITERNGEFLFVSNRDQRIGGTAIDFAQKIIEPGCSLGRARQLLRPFLNKAHYTPRPNTKRTKDVPELRRTSAYDFASVAKRLRWFDKVGSHHPFLCDERLIPSTLLEHPRVSGRIFHSAKYNSIIFPHYGPPANTPESEKRCINGYEIKSSEVSLFSSAGRKTLWSSAAVEADRVLAVTESGVDALSYLALHGADGTRAVSVAGNINSIQPTLLQSAVRKMGQGAHVVAAFDNDPAGDKLTETLRQILRDAGRGDLEFRDHRPQERGMDWNTVLQASSIAHKIESSPSLAFRR